MGRPSRHFCDRPVRAPSIFVSAAFFGGGRIACGGHSGEFLPGGSAKGVCWAVMPLFNRPNRSEPAALVLHDEAVNCGVRGPQISLLIQPMTRSFTMS